MAASTSSSSSDTPARAASAASGGGLAQYLKDVQTELKKAEWPSRAELIRLTQVVLVLIVVVAVYCGGLDALLSLVSERLFNKV